MSSGNPPAGKPSAPPADLTIPQKQAKALNVTPGQGECPDPDGEDYGAQRFLLYHNWECIGLVRDRSSLWLSPREPREASKATEPIMADDLFKEKDKDGKWVVRRRLAQVQVKDRDTKRMVPAFRPVLTDPGQPYTLNAAVIRQMRYNQQDAMKLAKERQAESRLAKVG